jgi:hypothetical protein
MKKLMPIWFVVGAILIICTNGCHSTSHNILGVWGLKGEPVNDFKIEKDSIYYIDYEKYYKYTLTKEDTLVIYFDGFIEQYKILMSGRDTMFTINRDSTKSCFVKAR